MHQPTENTDVDMERIATQYGTQMLRMCFMYLKDMQLAEDAVQDTMLKIYRNYAQFEGNSGEKTWVMRIAINV
ncbi:MAG: sigma factor, partial [Oscillospiraceae bacterium]